MTAAVLFPDSNDRPQRETATKLTAERSVGPDGLCSFCGCTDAGGPDDCYAQVPKHETLRLPGCPTYVCVGCLRLTPWCNGGTDTEVCDDCWVLAHSLLEEEEWTRICSEHDGRVPFAILETKVAEARAAKAELDRLLR